MRSAVTSFLMLLVVTAGPAVARGATVRIVGSISTTAGATSASGPTYPPPIIFSDSKSFGVPDYYFVETLSTWNVSSGTARGHSIFSLIVDQLAGGSLQGNVINTSGRVHGHIISEASATAWSGGLCPGPNICISQGTAGGNIAGQLILDAPFEYTFSASKLSTGNSASGAFQIGTLFFLGGGAGSHFNLVRGIAGPGTYLFNQGGTGATSNADGGTGFNNSFGGLTFDLHFQEVAAGLPQYGFFQSNPRLPTSARGNLVSSGGSIENEILDFFPAAESGNWFGAPQAYGYDFAALDGAIFNEILSLPLGVGVDDRFAVSAEGVSLGVYFGGESVDFEALLGHGVSSFRISGIELVVGSPDPVRFPVRLEFDRPFADFSMTAVPEPDHSLLLIAGISYIGFADRNRRTRACLRRS